MKVKDLIKKLKAFNQDMEVVLDADSDGYYFLEEIVVYTEDEDDDPKIALNWNM